MTKESQLQERLQRQAERRRRAEQDQRTILAQASFLGGLGLVFVLPVVGGAYLGHWLDSLVAGYSVRWTVGCLLLGIGVGAVNVYLIVKRTDEE